MKALGFLLAVFGGTGTLVLTGIVTARMFFKEGPFVVMDYQPPLLPEEKAILAWLGIMALLAVSGLILLVWNRKASL